MKPCRNCGLSIGDTATFCPVCCAVVEPEDSAPVTAPAEAAAKAAPQPAEAPPSAAAFEAEARACEKTDPGRAAALYRRAIVEHLDTGEDPLDAPSVARDVQRDFDRLSLVLKRHGRGDEALEEIDAAAYLGLVDGEGRGTKAQRDALAKRREALRRRSAKA